MVSIYSDITGRVFILRQSNNSIELSIEEMAQLKQVLDSMFKQVSEEGNTEAQEEVAPQEAEADIIPEETDVAQEIPAPITPPIKQPQPVMATKIVMPSPPPKPAESPAKKLISRLERMGQRVM